MPKAILEFNLPEESEEFKLAQKAGAYSSAIFEIYQTLFRNPLKYSELTEEKTKILEELRDKFIEICNDADVEF